MPALPMPPCWVAGGLVCVQRRAPGRRIAALESAWLNLQRCGAHRAPKSWVTRCMASSNGVGESRTSISSVDELSGAVAVEAAEPPEELSPLIEALERARLRANAATALREALESEAQEVAQLAIQARDAAAATRKKQEAVAAEAEAAAAVQRKVADELAAVEARAADPAGETALAAAAAVDASPTGTVDLTAPQQREQAAALGGLRVAKQAELDAVVRQSADLDARLAALVERCASSEMAAVRAEEVASAAMAAAEGAVRDEMEAAAVAKETASALGKALTDLQELGVAFGTCDKRVADLLKEEQAKAQTALKLAAEVFVDKVPEAADVALRTGPAAPAAAAPAIEEGTAAGASLYARLYAVAHFFAQARAGLAELASRVPIPHGTEGLVESCWLLLTSVVAVPLVCMVPGGSAVLGFLAGGALIGPHALGIVKDVEGVRHLAELGVVFLLFNIGLELSLDRLRSMQKFVFGLGSAQVVATLVLVAYTMMAVLGASGPASIVLGGGLALSSTAVAMQVLQDRAETGSRHGRATFAVLLFQDLAVVVLLMLIPLLAPSNGAPTGFSTIARALGIAAVKAVACIGVIIAGGRTLLRPIYRRIADMGNADVFAALTLLVVLGTSVLTQIAGLSLALGAFLAGLLIAETEFALQVESDIAPYKGLLMGLFFMTVGMEISAGLFIAKLRTVLAAIAVLLIGKAPVMAGLGPLFGLTRMQAVRSGLLLAAGGEFAFVAFGEAMAHGLVSKALVSELFLVVALTMALTPFLADLGARLGKAFESNDFKALQASEGEVEELRGHVIICGFGRVGQTIGQLLAERLIPFVAVDVRVDRVQAGKALDLPVYFGDAGSPAVLHSLGAHRAACAVITLDTPGANYRSVWALHKHFPHVKSYVRAHDVDHGLNLEKAGATAVVPETLEPGLQLASAVLSNLNMPPDDVQEAIQSFRRNHLMELQVLCKNSGSTLGYGFSSSTVDLDDEADASDDGAAPRAPLAEVRA
ncbi:hypothetical protein WJX81_005409 [Elliptochloris bilobata]|uniref:RCK N-terminal domain-containing protein n=1 Tax=Elliptochloris bilobata TaxID=381761 RepID=A0AAW1RLT3_9CHLO